MPIPYTTDGGNLGNLSNAQAVALVATLFGVWEAVPTSSIRFVRTGGINTQLVPSGDVQTMADLNAIAFNGNPIIFDADGSLFNALFGVGNQTLGIAGPTFTSANGGQIASGRALINGRFHDGIQANGESTQSEFEATLIHEFGHFSGLDHSQININCLSGTNCANGSDDTFGLPTMFPISIGGLTELPGQAPERTLAADDIAWISFFYPETVNNPPNQIPFATTTGMITGDVFFSDGVTGLQGANVIARQVDDPATSQNESRRNAISVVSGFKFTEVVGNSLAGNPRSTFGSSDPAVKGSYTLPGLPITGGSTAYRLEVESIDPSFTGGSSVGPLSTPIPVPGTAVPFTVTVTPGQTLSGRNIVVNGTPPRFDTFDLLARNDTRATATPLFNGTQRASLSPFPDEDFYSFSAAAGANVTVEIFSSRPPLNTRMDSVLDIQDGTGARPSTCRTPANPNGTFTQPCLNDDISPPGVLDSRLEFRPAASGTFFIHVTDARGDARPDFLYDIVLSGSANNPPAPPNDDSTLSTTITDVPFTQFQVISGGTTDFSDPIPTCGNGSTARSVFFNWTAPSNGTMTADTFGSNYNTILSVWTGGPGRFAPVACNDDAPGTLQSRVQISVTLGTQYFFMVSATGPSDEGSLIFNLSFQAAAAIPVAQNVTIIPHSASGGGFLTRLFVSNLTNVANALTINRMDTRGNVVSTTTSTLAPAATILIADTESQRSQPLTVRWFAIGSPGAVAASNLFDFDGAALTPPASFRTAVGALASPPLTAFTVPVRVATANVTVGVALSNLNASSNIITLKLLNQSGTLVATDSLTLGPFEQTSFSVHDRPAFSIVLTQAEFIGALLVTTQDASHPVAAIGVGNNLGQLFSLPVTSGVSQ